MSKPDYKEAQLQYNARVALWREEEKRRRDALKQKVAELKESEENNA